MDKTFGRELNRLARMPDVRFVLEIGTWYGGGSSWCIAQGLRQSISDPEKPDKWLVTLEMFEPAWEYASQTLHRLPVTCMKGGTVGVEGYLTPEQMTEDSDDRSNEHYQLYYERDISLARESPALLESLCSQNNFDLVLIDGNEYTGFAEYLIVERVCKPKYIAMHDTGTLKTRKVESALAQNSDKWRKISSGEDGVGWAVFQDQTYPSTTIQIADLVVASGSAPASTLVPTIIVGVFADARQFSQDRGIRDSFRSSISVSASQFQTFNLKHFFYVGRDVDVQAENTEFRDIIQGVFPENINDGKTFEWFKAAAHMDGDWVIKMDQDTVVKWSRLALVASKTGPLYFGTRVLRWNEDLSVSPVNGHAPSNQCHDFSKGCWFYMSGGFYGVSMDVARAISSCGFARENKRGYEDALMGFWMGACIPEVRVWELPFGQIHYHYITDKADMIQKIRDERISAFGYDQAIVSTKVSVTLIGGLGNQLFQAASSFGIALSRHAVWCVTNLNGSALSRNVRFQVQPIQCQAHDVPYVDENGQSLKFQQHMMDAAGSIHVGAFLQSFRYFALSGLPFQLHDDAYGKEWVRTRSIQVGIHVRRTDQLTAAHGGRDPGVGYFRTALDKLKNILGGTFNAVVCTDDVDWIRHQSIFNGMNIRDGSDPAGEDMAILSACKHVIMSIGTFGWWASYLRDDFGETFYYATPFEGDRDYSEHFPSHWTGITDHQIAGSISPISTDLQAVRDS
jgi:galactoside 2-L-fucosyltransferase 1/2